MGRTNFDLGPSRCADHRVDLRDFAAIPLFLRAKVSGNSPVSGLCDQVKGSVTRNKGARVSIDDVRLNRKAALFPPIINEIQSSANHRQMKIAKAIVGKKPSVREIGMHVFAPHAVDQYLAV